MRRLLTVLVMGVFVGTLGVPAVDAAPPSSAPDAKPARDAKPPSDAKPAPAPDEKKPKGAWAGDHSAPPKGAWAGDASAPARPAGPPQPVGTRPEN
jgi:hypothetical protein